ncbi:MAG: tRNA 2-thiocytidine biosynthesis protein TtcA [Anaerolineae bacterium]|nr:tRNA 2-thiocytidine biosynthesis protein TtcA [Anaerolineae bacterium]
MNDPGVSARYLRKAVNRAVHTFALIEDGDRIAVGVSGGKDSRTLLDLLVRGIDIPGRYDVVAIHIDGADVGMPDLRPTLEPWFRALDIRYEITPLEVTEGEALPLTCFRCAWRRRQALFLAADRAGCNKVALGHHADDAAVTTLLSVLYKGKVESLAPRRPFFAGKLTIIRPLILATEKAISRYARAKGWEFPPHLECPQLGDSRRVTIERFLASLDNRERKQIRANLWRLSQHSNSRSNDDEP